MQRVADWVMSKRGTWGYWPYVRDGIAWLLWAAWRRGWHEDRMIEYARKLEGS